MIRLAGVTVRYGTRTVLDGLDLDLPVGSVTAVTGPNGSGKTTLARVLLGLLDADDGVVTGLAGCRRAAVFQEDRLCPGLSALANLRLVRGRDPAAALRRVGLAEADLDRPVADLSGGQRRRVAIARALAAPSDLLVLDEPFAGVDRGARTAVVELVRAHATDGTGRTTVLITHDPAEAAALGARSVVLG